MNKTVEDKKKEEEIANSIDNWLNIPPNERGESYSPTVGHLVGLYVYFSKNYENKASRFINCHLSRETKTLITEMNNKFYIDVDKELEKQKYQKSIDDIEKICIANYAKTFIRNIFVTTKEVWNYV